MPYNESFGAPMLLNVAYDSTAEILLCAAEQVGNCAVSAIQDQ